MTHGTRMEEPALLNRLIAAGLDRIEIPIYGSKPNIHDQATQTPGSFISVTKGVKELLEKAPDIEVVVHCLIMKKNKEDLCNIVDYVQNELKANDFFFSIPCLAMNNHSEFYVPFKELGPYAREVYKYALKVNKNISFCEIPFCIFGEYNPVNIKNCIKDFGPPNLGKYNQPPEEQKTSISNLPRYRLKKKTNLCIDCKAFEKCDGFFINDIENYGTQGIQNL